MYIHLKDSNLELIKNSLICIMEVSRLYYDYIEENINQLVEISKNFVSDVKK